MKRPPQSLKLSVEQAAARQVDAAIDAFNQFNYDIAITLAGAAEGMIEREGSHLYSFLKNHPRALAEFSSKEWISLLNQERNWLKHVGAPRMEIHRTAALTMIARAMTKLQPWSKKMDQFKPVILRELS